MTSIRSISGTLTVMSALAALGLLLGFPLPLQAQGGQCPLECGDGIVMPPEECDDGNDVDDDECTNDCTVGDGGWCEEDDECASGDCENGVCVEPCGNGSVDTGEQCDDGNTEDGDGCSATCQTEECSSLECSLWGNRQCRDQGLGCLQLSEAPCFECGTKCGNLELDEDEGEQCDDGNTKDDDGCSSTCQVEEIFCGLDEGGGSLGGGGQSSTGQPGAGGDGGSCPVILANRTINITCSPRTAVGVPCSPAEVITVTVAESSRVQLQYTVASGHCAQVRVHMRVNGSAQETVSVYHGYQSGPSPIPHPLSSILNLGTLPPGQYTIELRGDAKSDCAGGTLPLADWGGTAVVRAYTADQCNPPPTQCGNGIAELGETCEDGNTSNGDGCSSICQVEGGGGGACTDSDGGDVPGTPGVVVLGSSINPDYCKAPTVLKEFTCQNGNVFPKDTVCSAGTRCINGACSASATIANVCKDFDFGADTTTASTVTVNGQPFQDACEREDIVIEQVCNGDARFEIQFYCGNGLSCVQGRCE